jgi:hypothetical protein
VSGAVPFAATVRVAPDPSLIVAEPGCVMMAGAVQAGVTVTATALLDAMPQAFKASHQKDVVAVRADEVKLLPVPAGRLRSRAAPSYHCSVTGAVPVDDAVSVTRSPAVARALDGVTETDGR